MNPSGKIIPKITLLHYLSLFLVVFLIDINKVAAQSTSNSEKSQVIDSNAAGISLKQDSMSSDSTQKAANVHSLEALGIILSPDAIDKEINATANDSAVMDMTNNIFHLYGDARIDYEDMKLSAGRVSYHQSSSMVTAAPGVDSVTRLQKPTFVQGNETFVYDSMQYNFKSKRAIVRNARSQYGEGFVLSQQVKRNPDQSIYGLNSVYTTCALETPHFGIRARKIKVIPGKIIASGSANIEIESIPTPLFLPFGIFPITEKQRSGFRLPTYTVEERRGLGLLNGGYYFYINDYVDFLLTGNIYTKGSWALSGMTSYANRYRYSGALSLSYANNKMGEVYEPSSSISKDFMLNWRHQSDAKAMPGQSFNATVNVGTSSFYSNTSYNPNQILNNQFTSSISYSKSWTGKPFSLTASARHNQNTQTRVVDVTLPEFNFFIAQFNPFQSKKAVGTHWYEKITMSYSFSALNQTSFIDSTFKLSNLSMDNFRYGFKHAIPISASYTVLRYINMSVSTSYNEYWMTQRQYRNYNDLSGTIDTSLSRGFFTARDVDANLQLTTRIYGMKMFKKGTLKGIRHVLTPNVGIGYRPDYAAKPFNYYYQTRLDASNNLTYLSPYENSVIGVPGLGQYGKFSSTMNYGLNNNLQIKVRNKKDTTGTGKNITLIDALSLNGNYNFAADSFNFSPLTASFRTNILNNFNISAGAIFDPYTFDYNEGRRINKLLVNQSNKLARLTSASLSLGASLRSHSKDKKKVPAQNEDDFNRLMQNGGYNDYIDFDIPWNLSVSYSLNLSKQYNITRKADTIIMSQFAQVNGDFNLTKRWKVTFTTGYDFTNKQLSITSIDIYRDLHCWEMRLGTIPFGPYKSYNFSLNVKASVLQDLKLLRRRDFRDNI